MDCKAYAKINLSLDITGRREDGYHTLDTVMHSVSLWDRVSLIREKGGGPGIRVRCSESYLPVDDKNTAYKAARLFLERFGLTGESLEIAVEKHIPTRAGMGGGSADAAAVLHGLNELYGAGLSLPQLLELGLQVGADVPFCLHGGACRCTGVGEILQPVTPLPECYLAICKPPVGMSTPRAYAQIDRFSQGQPKGTAKLLSALESGDLRQIGRNLSNHFDTAMRLMQVRQIEKLMLSAGAFGAMMTGSGSAVYGVFEKEEHAQNALLLVKDRGETFLTKPLSHL